MKRFIIILAIVTAIQTLLIGCSTQTNPEEKDTGENRMYREICVIETVGKDSFVVKNTKEELYRIEKVHLKEFREGDKIFLLYTSRTSGEDGEYIPEVYAIYPDDNTILPLERE